MWDQLSRRADLIAYSEKCSPFSGSASRISKSIGESDLLDRNPSHGQNTPLTVIETFHRIVKFQHKIVEQALEPALPNLVFAY